MRFQFQKRLLAVFIVLSQVGTTFYLSSAVAGGDLIRWTGAEDADGRFSHVLTQLNQKLGTRLNEKDFLLQEDRELAFNHYKRWVQLVNQVPVHGNFIRLWTEIDSNQLVQLEANIEDPNNAAIGNDEYQSFNTRGNNQTASRFQTRLSTLSSEDTIALIRNSVEKYQDDPYFRGIDWKDEWHQGQVIRFVKVKGKRGYHHIRIGMNSKKIISYSYREFPQGDLEIPVQVYPIYEESGSDSGTLPRVPAKLKHILTQIPQVTGDIYSALKTKSYFDVKIDPLLGEMETGRAKGYWSLNYVKEQATLLRNQLPLTGNDWNTGVLLEGRYATINIHPEAIDKFKPVDFKPVHSSALFLTWAGANYEGRPAFVMTPETAYSGQRLTSPNEAFSRRAQRLPNHDPAQYISDGFDEIQVYYAIDTLFEELHLRGFSDPELSTRPFNAFLFNPDIAYRDNAYYTEDTINFTTYSPKSGNSARDNSTIWHELGHGVMDRLMGNHIELADTGGLSEGMADFVAAMVIQAVTQGAKFPGSDQFRIINQTGFYLTNEVHDDGQAYGGAMKDFMDAVMQANGPSVGLNQVADVVLEAMRLTRDYPGLTAPEWFKHLLFADSLGRAGLRQPGELAPHLLKSLAGRNFRIDGGPVAQFSLINLTATPSIEAGQEIEAGSPGARETPIRLKLDKDQTASFELQASLKSSDGFKFHYPAEVVVRYHGSPLQGAIHWVGKENGPQTYILNQESDRVTLPLKVTGTCDEINRTDGSCVDYADVLIFNGENGSNGTEQGAPAVKKPIAKKRFYLRISAKNKTRHPYRTVELG